MVHCIKSLNFHICLINLVWGKLAILACILATKNPDKLAKFLAQHIFPSNLRIIYSTMPLTSPLKHFRATSNLTCAELN